MSSIDSHHSPHPKACLGIMLHLNVLLYRQGATARKGEIAGIPQLPMVNAAETFGGINKWHSSRSTSASGVHGSSCKVFWIVAIDI